MCQDPEMTAWLYQVSEVSVAASVAEARDYWYVDMLCPHLSKVGKGAVLLETTIARVETNPKGTTSRRHPHRVRICRVGTSRASQRLRPLGSVRRRVSCLSHRLPKDSDHPAPWSAQWRAGTACICLRAHRAQGTAPTLCAHNNGIARSCVLVARHVWRGPCLAHLAQHR